MEFHEQPLSNPLWSEEDFLDLKTGRGIKEEDLPLIESLAALPKSIALDYHNFFTNNQRDVLDTIDRDLKNLSEKIERETDDQRRGSLINEKIYLEIQKQIVSKYDWQTAWGVNVALERRKKTTSPPASVLNIYNLS